MGFPSKRWPQCQPWIRCQTLDCRREARKGRHRQSLALVVALILCLGVLWKWGPRVGMTHWGQAQVFSDQPQELIVLPAPLGRSLQNPQNRKRN